MEWITAVRKAVEYIEEHLNDKISAQDVSGGDKMDVKIRNLFEFKVIGFAKVFDYETAYNEIPKYWDEICEKYAANVYAGNPPANEYEKALMAIDNNPEEPI